MKRLIAPSILAADFNHLGDAIQIINDSEADYVHCDVMDGVFVPNISFGIPVVQHVSRIAKKPLDVHLMIVEPDKYIKPFADAGADSITVHYETSPHLHRTIGYIKEQGAKAAVCLNPHTPVAVLEDIISEVDMVLLMSVNPGFGGQQFIENTYKKVNDLRNLIIKKNPNCLIQVDGGVNYETGRLLYDEGVDILVAGSFIFGSENPSEIIARLKSV